VLKLANTIPNVKGQSRLGYILLMIVLCLLMEVKHTGRSNNSRTYSKHCFVGGSKDDSDSTMSVRVRTAVSMSAGGTLGLCGFLYECVNEDIRWHARVAHHVRGGKIRVKFTPLLTLTRSFTTKQEYATALANYNALVALRLFPSVYTL